MICKPIPIQWVIPMDSAGTNTPFARYRCHVDARDEGAGPYLVIRFVNDEPTGYERADEGYLNSESEIEELGEKLKTIWRDLQYGDESA